MSALRVVLIAEGNGELRSDPLRGPLSAIHADDQGPGHVIFARAIAARSSVPRAAVHFIEPLRTMRATIARGSRSSTGRPSGSSLTFSPSICLTS